MLQSFLNCEPNSSSTIAFAANVISVAKKPWKDHEVHYILQNTNLPETSKLQRISELLGQIIPSDLSFMRK